MPPNDRQWFAEISKDSFQGVKSGQGGGFVQLWSYATAAGAGAGRGFRPSDKATHQPAPKNAPTGFLCGRGFGRGELVGQAQQSGAKEPPPQRLAPDSQACAGQVIQHSLHNLAPRLVRVAGNALNRVTDDVRRGLKLGSHVYTYTFSLERHIRFVRGRHLAELGHFVRPGEALVTAPEVIPNEQKGHVAA